MLQDKNNNFNNNSLNHQPFGHGGLVISTNRNILLNNWFFKYFIIRYQMNAIHICPNSEDDTFVSIVLSNFAEVTEENFAEVVMRCHKLNEQMKQVKFYTVKDVIIAASEFYYMEEDDLSFQIKLALSSLIAAKVNYKKLDK